MIGLNSILLTIDEPVLTDPYQKESIQLMGNIISYVFISEMVFKVIVMGFVKGKHAYLKDNWNKLDFVIVSFSILNTILDVALKGNKSVSFIKGFRALRALRPLRVVSKNEGNNII